MVECLVLKNINFKRFVNNIISKTRFHKNKKSLKRYFANTSWLLLEKTLRIISGVFIGIWVARYLGPDNYGLLNFSISFVGLFQAIATLGLESILVRELVKREIAQNVLLGTTFRLKLIGALVTIVIVFISVSITSEDQLTKIFVIIIISGSIFQSFNIIDVYFQSKVLSKYVVFANMITLAISSLTKIILIVLNASLVAFVIVIIFDQFILTVGLLYFYNYKVGSLKKWRFENEIAKKLLKDSWPLIPHKISFMIIANIDQVMLGFLTDKHTVGIYSLAYRMMMLMYSFSAIFSNSIFPALVKEGTVQKNRFILLYRFMLLLAVICISIYFLFGSKLLLLLFGPEYKESVAVLNWLIISVIFLFLSLASGKWYIVNNYTKLFLFRTLSGVIINITLNYFLINIYGIYGAVIATLATTFYIAYLSNYFHRLTFKNLNLIHNAIFCKKNKF